MRELAAPALGRGIPNVVALNAGTRVRNTKNQNPKGKLGARPCLSLFRENRQWSDDSLRGTLRRGANRSSLPEGKPGADPEADGSIITIHNILST